MGQKLLLFGLDGGSLDIIQEMVKNGELPNFEKLMKNGVYGKLESTIPPITIPAWPSMFTGLNPGKLGVVDHIGLNEKYQQNVKRPSWRGCFFWDILSDKGFRTGIVNVPGIGKIYKLNGFMVSSFYKDSDVYPKNLKVKQKEIPPLEVSRVSKKIDLLIENLEKRKKSLPQILHKEWDLLVFVVGETDKITHYTNDWSKVREVYKKSDELLSLIFDETENCNIIISSDHGIKEIQRRVYINKLLERMGFLTKKKGISRGLVPKIGGILQKIFGRSILQSLVSFFPFTKQREIKNIMSLGAIQKKETKLFGYGARAANYSRLWVNNKDRFESGIVEENQIKAVKEDFKNKVKNLGKEENLIEKIHDGTEVYKTRGEKWIPDLVLKLPEDCIEDYSLGSKVEEKEKGFSHALHGVFMAYGPNIKSSEDELKNLKIYDIAPTILHMFGAPVSEEMEGKVLKEIFREGSEPAKKSVERRKIQSREKIREKIRKLKAEKKI